MDEDNQKPVEVNPEKQISDIERKAIIRSAIKKAFEKYDDVFQKLGQN